jgi:hypothetical protein
MKSIPQRTSTKYRITRSSTEKCSPVYRTISLTRGYRVEKKKMLQHGLSCEKKKKTAQKQYYCIED